MFGNWKWVFVLAVTLALTVPAATQGSSAEMPASVLLDSLSHLFDGAEFDHNLHLDIAEDCADCHHHTTGTGVSDPVCIPCHDRGAEAVSVACRDCHEADPFSAESLREKDKRKDDYHFDKPGLKAAYHLNCLQCHVEMGGPEGCQDCHERNADGDAFYYSGPFSPKGEQASKGH